ncbi:(5-formylfuran-3-yl)methyl phosphate synthase [Variovorax sp. dw_954]|uniref:(5-formylfuran-3-yl)methyl phosphate synthase n=1 Tax=Variovorax sp. dw_954 TaxID=2720078 RepID=UPI001BD1DBF9|nr:(5-formylfuran-3-yl)methyl phosphate synthase [Variovorax sp. dw_954]
MKMLVSVRSVEEALLAADGGADFIDLKEPGAGALGGLPVTTIREIVVALRRHRSGLLVSATIGDVPMHEAQRIAACVDAVGGCGVDYVKVGIERDSHAPAVLDALAASGWPIVPVFIADRGLDMAHVAHACALRFPGVMADTFDKRAGSLFDVLPMQVLREFVDAVRGEGVMVGLAGALRATHAPLLQELAPDFAGFRTAVCVGDRSTALDPQRLRALGVLMRGRAAEAVVDS